jgi:hypothetical protein
MSSVHTSHRRLGNARECLGNTSVSSHAIAVKPSFISAAHGPRRAMGHVSAPESTTEAGVVQSQRSHVSAGSLLMSKAGSGVVGRMVASDPS